MPKRKQKTDTDSEIEPVKLKVAELREELEKRGLDTSGKKAELVARLEDAIQGAATSPAKKSKPSSSTAPLKTTDYSKMTVAQLKKELKDKGLDTSGKKAELVARLQGSGSETDGAGEETKEEPTDELKDETDFSKAMRALKSSHEKKAVSKKRKVDAQVPFGSSYTVVDDWDCMLNQTNIGQNNNKYYIIQLLSRNSKYSLWTRWGRVGEPGQNAMKGPFGSFEACEKEFKKKFYDKTKNNWVDRDEFVPVKGKYTLIEMDDEQDSQEAMEVEGKLAALEETDAPPTIVKPPMLDRPTQDLVKLIFDNDMFREAMKSMEIDTKKMPLGKLSKPQIAKGFEALEAIEAAINDVAPRSKLAELTSKFYTIIPHDFGRRVPPVITDLETLQKKFDMLLVLGDIEIAQGIEKDKEEKQKKAGGEVPNPLDVKYDLLKADLSHLNPSSDEYKILEKYLRATEPHWRKLGILDVWRVDRQGEHDRFKVHDAITNRRLLWHGTNVAVVAAILKSGLRIMPHSGGRVGKGIYFASECSKSAGYVGCTHNIGIMFLNEVVLGNEHHITVGDSSLTAPPPGYNCVIAKGRTEPDPKEDTTITLDSKPVDVPQGKPIDTKHSASHFSQSEYLVYKESQARIRYLLKLRF